MMGKTKPIRWCLAAAMLAAIATAGCGSSDEGVNATYGRRRGAGATSVNGTSVLARMFQNAGHRVVNRGKGGGKIEDCKVIVWAPNRFEPPTANERETIQDWLAEGDGRTFIYIGRDYDAAIDYWQHAADSAGEDADLREEYLRRLAAEQSQFESSRSEIPKDEDVSWFAAQRDHPRRNVEQLAGPWSDGINASDASITIRSRFDPPDESAEDNDNSDAQDDVYNYGYYDEVKISREVLLAAMSSTAGDNTPFDVDGGFQSEDGAPLVTRVTHDYWSDGAVVVVTNGSFLLNLPLVNHEHRKLAGKLIDECGYEPAKVAFWDADTFEPFAATAEQHDQWSVLTTWPLNIILLHLGVLGIVYVMWRFPIFGPAKDLPPAATSDFSKHINSLGDLMAGTNEAGYARAKLQAYRVNVRGETRDPHSQSPLGLQQKPVQLDPAAAQFEHSPAMAEYRRGDYHEAVRLVNPLIDQHPRQPTYWQFKGECLFKLKRFDEAVACFQQLQAIGGAPAQEAFLWVALCHQNAGRTTEAMGTIERFLATPGDANPELISKAKAALGKLQDEAQQARRR